MSEYYVSEGDLISGIVATARKLNECEKEISRLKKEVEILEKSNDFYADLNNWILENLSNGYPILIHKEQLNGGKLAREVKQQLKELRSK